jgi:tRNA(Ile)-lysidine synthetase-like protein
MISRQDLKLRNWRPGDRFRPAHAGSEKKVKELIQSLKVEQSGRALWPVVAAGEQVIWVRGTRPRSICLERDGVRHNLVIEVEETRG